MNTEPNEETPIRKLKEKYDCALLPSPSGGLNKKFVYRERKHKKKKTEI